MSLNPPGENTEQTESSSEAGVDQPEKGKEASSVTYQSTLVSNVIRDISADETSVWIATDRGVSMLDRSTDIWRHFTKEDGLGSDGVNAVAVDGQWIWFGAKSGANRYDK